MRLLLLFTVIVLFASCASNVRFSSSPSENTPAADRGVAKPKEDAPVSSPSEKPVSRPEPAAEDFASQPDEEEEGSSTPFQEGVASYYAHAFHGRRTANGETFDMNDLTAAHKTLPFNTKLRVENTINGKSVVVRVNDRGPFAKNRIIDLSLSAAKRIDLIGPGSAPVKLFVINEP